jgi:hypothetical protein
MKRINRVFIKWYLVVGVLTIFYLAGTAQNPGGVKNPILWKTFEGSKDYLNNGSELFNYNSYKYFDADLDKLDLNLKPFSKASIYLVFGSLSQGKILSLENGSKSIFTLNDENVVVNQTVPYLETFDKPKILYYHDVFSRINIKENANILVKNDGTENESFIGGLSEVIVFDKIIKKMDRKKIDSYLSIKYGIPLVDSAKYYFSNGDLIWDGKKQFPYQHHFTGIARDDNSGLYQKQSGSLYSDIRLVLGLNKIEKHNSLNLSKVENLESLIWADNQNDINFKNIGDGILQMGRKWILKNNIKSKDVNRIHLMIDFDKSKDFNPDFNSFLVLGANDNLSNFDGLRTYPLKRLKDKVYECYFEIEDLNEGNLQYFSFRQQEGLLFKDWVVDLDCKKKMANLTLEVKSGNANQVRYELKNSSKETIGSGSMNNNTHTIKNLPFGMYSVSYFLNDSLLQSSGIGFSEMDCTEEGEILLYPNPVLTNYPFVIKSNSFSNETVVIEIFDSKGQNVRRDEARVKELFEYTSSLICSGVYVIRLKGDNKMAVKSIVVQ